MDERMTTDNCPTCGAPCKKQRVWDDAGGYHRYAYAHLTQPAQSVDVGAIREVIDSLRTWHDEGTDSMADELTRAIGN